MGYLLTKSVLISWYKLRTVKIYLNPLMIITRYNPDMTNQRINLLRMNYTGFSAFYDIESCSGGGANRNNPRILKNYYCFSGKALLYCFPSNIFPFISYKELLT